MSMGFGEYTKKGRKLDLGRLRLPSKPWHKALPALAVGALAFWVGQQLSVWLSPAAHAYRALAPAQPQVAAAAVAQSHWFGEAPAQAVAAPPPIRLLGVYAPSLPGVQGFAVVDNNGRAEPLLQGKQTADGWELVKVAPNGVTIRSGGNEQFVPLQARHGGAGGGDSAPQQPAAMPGMAPPPQMPGAVPLPVPDQNAVPDAQPQPAVNPAAMIRQ
ncbi:type II secretion system protein N [Chromobacterium alticapitis]|nr:type II secretion system protein N [Chromobacterium alticapitis]